MPAFIICQWVLFFEKNEIFGRMRQTGGFETRKAKGKYEMKVVCPYCNSEYEVEDFSGVCRFQCGVCDKKFLFVGRRAFKYGTFTNPVFPGTERLICPNCGCSCDIGRGTAIDTPITCTGCRMTFAVPNAAPPQPAVQASFAQQPIQPVVQAPFAQQPIPPVRPEPPAQSPLQPVRPVPIAQSPLKPVRPEPLAQLPQSGASGNGGEEKPDKMNQMFGGKFDVRSKKFKYIFLGVAAALMVLIVIGVLALLSPGPKQIARKWQTAVIEQGVKTANELYALPDGIFDKKSAREQIADRYADYASNYFRKAHQNDKDDAWMKAGSVEEINFFNKHFREEKFDEIKTETANGKKFAMVSSQNYYVVLLKAKEGWKIVDFAMK